MKHCENCQFYKIDPTDMKRGFCHFDPPTPVVVMGQDQFKNAVQQIMSVWPSVRKNDFCHNFEPRFQQIPKGVS